MKRILIAAAVAIGSLGPIAAVGATLFLNCDGSVSSPQTGLSIGFVAAMPDWSGTWSMSTVSGKDPMRIFPDCKEGTVRWRFGEDLGAGKTKLVAGETRGTAALSFGFAAKKGFETELSMLSVNLPVEAYAGGFALLDGKKRVELPLTGDPKRIHLGGGNHRTVSVTAKDGSTLTFDCLSPVRVRLQDSRKWGGDFNLRLFAERKPFCAGDRLVRSVTVSDPNGAVRIAYAQPTVVAAGPDWVPIDFRKNIVAGSVLDLSAQGLQDAPAGKYGWTKVTADGHFEFEKRPGVTQRFYGVNLCFTANFPPHDLADELVTRLVRSGYNALRIHHYERDLMVKSGKMEFRKDAIDRLDYLIASAINAGLYVTTDLYVSRNVTWKEIGLAERGKGEIAEKANYKHLAALWDPAFENWKLFSKKFLEHVNPYTGRAYLNEPGLNLISLVNEGQLAMHWSDSKRDPIVQSAYTEWLAKKREKNPSFLSGASEKTSELNPYKPQTPSGQALLLFMADVERRSAGRMIAFLRELGSKALFTNINNGPHPASMQEVRADCFDYVDVHFYVDHPKFLEKPWRLPSAIPNRNPVFDPKLNLMRPAAVRLADKPLCSTEWNFSGPGQYRGVGGIMTGAFGALQDWDGLWRFAYAHGEGELYEGVAKPGYFNTATDPLGRASDMASVCLFLRRDVRPLAEGTVLRLPPSTAPEADRAQFVQPEWSWQDALWTRRLATAAASTRVPAGMDEIAFTEKLRTSMTPPFPVRPNGAIVLDRRRGSFKIDTPRTAGGFVPEGTLDAGVVSFTVQGGAATVWASSVDAEKTDLAHAKRIAVTHLTDVQADGNVYVDSTKTTLIKWGERRAIVRTGRAEVRLALADSRSYKVWALDTAGERLAPVPSRVENGSLVFTAEVAPPKAIINYEVSR